MKEIGKLDIKALQTKFSKYKVTEEIFTSKSGKIKRYDYIFSGFPGNSELEFMLFDAEDADTLYDLIQEDIKFTNGFFSVRTKDSIEVSLSPVSAKTATSAVHTKNNGKGKYKIADIHISFHGNEINVLIEGNNDSLKINSLARYALGVQADYKNKITATITGYNTPTNEGEDSDIRAILTSVLFDFEFTYGLGYEPTNIQIFSNHRVSLRAYAPLPETQINLLYKKYTPELIQYLHIAEKVDYPPFKFLCYYHVLEYFSDKSAYRIVSAEVKKMFFKPDFHLKTDFYVAQAIEQFKKENEKQTNDKTKLERVIKQFITREELSAQITSMGLEAHFSKETIFTGNKQLKLPALNFAVDSNFYPELTKRVYATRCSIVHSNPDFDENKAVPFNPTPSNLSKLRTEIYLISEIAKKIAMESIDA